MKQYYIQVAAASGLPFYIYNIPGTTGVNVAVDVVRELIAAVPNLRGIKFTAHDLYGMRKYIELDDGRFNVLSGADEIMVAAQAMGADGAIGTTENFLPRVFVDAYQAFHAGDVKTAEALQARINWTVNAFLSFSPLAAVKEIMRLLGFELGSPRPPLLALTDDQRGRLREMLEEIRVLQVGRLRDFIWVHSKIVQTNRAERPGRSRGRAPGVVEGCGAGFRARLHAKRSTAGRELLRPSAQDARD